MYFVLRFCESFVISYFCNILYTSKYILIGMFSNIIFQHLRVYNLTTLRG